MSDWHVNPDDPPADGPVAYTGQIEIEPGNSYDLWRPGSGGPRGRDGRPPDRGRMTVRVSASDKVKLTVGGRVSEPGEYVAEDIRPKGGGYTDTIRVERATSPYLDADIEADPDANDPVEVYFELLFYAGGSP